MMNLADILELLTKWMGYFGTRANKEATMDTSHVAGLTELTLEQLSILSYIAQKGRLNSSPGHPVVMVLLSKGFIQQVTQPVGTITNDHCQYELKAHWVGKKQDILGFSTKQKVEPHTDAYEHYKSGGS
jgi:hypothetical protein